MITTEELVTRTIAEERGESDAATDAVDPNAEKRRRFDYAMQQIEDVKGKLTENGTCRCATRSRRATTSPRRLAVMGGARAVVGGVGRTRVESCVLSCLHTPRTLPPAARASTMTTRLGGSTGGRR